MRSHPLGVGPEQARRRHGDAPRLRGPRRVVVADHEAWLWDAWVNGLHHELAWWPSDGRIRWSYPVSDDGRRSGFIALGPRYSPRYNLWDAMESVRLWVANEERRPG